MGYESSFFKTLFFFIVALLGDGSATADSRGRSINRQQQPNIVFILTDDQVANKYRQTSWLS